MMIDYINYRIMKKDIFKNFLNYKKNNFKNITFNDIDMYVLIMI
jgi:hypothetical protein